MGKTSIEWCDASVNPIRASLKGSDRMGHHCVKVSPGCAHCYASRMQPRFGMPPYQADLRPSDDLELFFDVVRLGEVLRRRTPTKWFWCDMTDLFGEWVPDAWIDTCLAVMALTPQHTHQIVTKRAARLRTHMSDPSRGDRVLGSAFASGLLTPNASLAEAYAGIIKGEAWPLPNVWLIVSAEDQTRYDERIGHLLRTPAAVRGLSLEPLLGPIDLRMGGNSLPDYSPHDPLPQVDWVIVGGESGPGARPMHPHWPLSLLRQCRKAGVPFFFKQWGEWQDGSRLPGFEGEIVLNTGRHAKFAEDFTADERSRWPSLFATVMAKVGKKTAGRLLDGREWNEFPRVEVRS
jgi:protein gp37